MTQIVLCTWGQPCPKPSNPNTPGVLGWSLWDCWAAVYSTWEMRRNSQCPHPWGRFGQRASAAVDPTIRVDRGWEGLKGPEQGYQRGLDWGPGWDPGEGNCSTRGQSGLGGLQSLLADHLGAYGPAVMVPGSYFVQTKRLGTTAHTLFSHPLVWPSLHFHHLHF